ncbi:DUF397 domain-containing protein [Streptomyces sp. LE64]|jgi:hypothetical protein|uniref:DUF397 domain-containing protein n=1 Tax=unclassified Streptomyces TaxID=2593676 RepID=UPI003316F8C2
MAIQQGSTRTWVKSSHSTGNGACIEVKSPLAHTINVRDSKVAGGPALALAPESWTSFVAGVHGGGLDRG